MFLKYRTEVKYVQPKNSDRGAHARSPARRRAAGLGRFVQEEPRSGLSQGSRRQTLPQRRRHLHVAHVLSDAAGSFGRDALRIQPLCTLDQAAGRGGRAHCLPGGRRSRHGYLRRRRSADGGHGGLPHRPGSGKDTAHPRSHAHEKRSAGAEEPSLRLRSFGPRHGRSHDRNRNRGGTRARHFDPHRHAALLLRRRAARRHHGGRLGGARQEAPHPHLRRRGRRAAAGGPSFPLSQAGIRSGVLLRRQGHSRSAKRGVAIGTKRPHRGRAPQHLTQLRHHRPRHEGQQGGDARHVGGSGTLPEARPRRRPAASGSAAWTPSRAP